MAQQKRKTSSTKKTSQTRKPRTSKSKKKKPKVFIPTDKIIILCSIVVILCTILLFLNTTMESNVREKPVSVPCVSSFIMQRKGIFCIYARFLSHFFAPRTYFSKKGANLIV